MKISFGRLAYQLDLMTLDEVMETLRAQDGTNLRFGTVAIEKGFINEDQVEIVLENQRGTHMPLGQVIASLGWVEPEILDRELRLYMKDKAVDA